MNESVDSVESVLAKGKMSARESGPRGRPSPRPIVVIGINDGLMRKQSARVLYETYEPREEQRSETTL